MKIIDKFIKWSLSKLNQWNQYRIEKYGTNVIDNPDNYEVLIPNTQDTKKTHYSNPLLVALNTLYVNNIAITGSYGSGKSSFLRKFENENAEWNYLPISLATFQDTKEIADSNEGESNSISTQHQDIERSILQQFFYREKDKTIPFSRFKKIKKVSKIDILSITLSVPYLYLYLFRPKLVKSLMPENIINFLHEYNTIFLGLALLLFFSGVYRILHYLSTFQISKVDVKKSTITISKQDKASILNEHLDEILYFFESTKYNVVIFEDIDRFENTEIFVKLRELNTLINNSKQIGRRIIFIYAIRDDMFLDKERTKFFDFIVPIIPYINPSNSEQKLIDKFKEEIKNNTLNEKFISQISWYIDDMRLLLNIYNEYMVYKNNLDSESLDHNKLLALIVCKNFYPLDFAKLHVREGSIYTLFSNKPKYIENKITKLKEKRQNKKNELNEFELKVKEEILENIQELKRATLAKLFEKTNAVKLTIGNHSQQTFTQLMAIDDLFDNIDNNITVEGYIHNYNNIYRESGQIEFNNIKYLQRKKIIEIKYLDEIDEIKKEIENINKKILQVKKFNLKQLFEVASDLIIDEKYIDKDLLIFLVRNGYIDERYETYISYFHEGSITQNDREFILSIQNNKALEPSYQLGNISKLVEKIEEQSFENEHVLNNELTTYLLKNINSVKKEKYFKLLSNGNKGSIEYIFLYLELVTEDEQKEFIKSLSWNGLWSYIDENYSSQKQNEYFKLLFNALDVDRLVELDMSEYLSRQTILPKYTKDDNDKCKELIKQLDIKFNFIKNPSDNPPLFSYIYENNYYILNPNIIKVVLIEKGNLESEKIDELKSKNLTTIRKSEAKKLIEYIDSEIDLYCADVLYGLEDNKEEVEETLLYLLNHEELYIEYKKDIINKVETKIQDIKSVENDELWVELFKSNKVEATWDNVMQYYLFLDSELDNDLIVFLDKKENAENLSTVRVGKEYCEKNEKFNIKILRDIIELNEFKIESYEYLIKNLGYGYKGLDISGLDEEKNELLVKYNRCQFEKECFDTLKAHTGSQHIALIEKNKTKFLEKLEEFELDADDVLKLLNSEVFKEEKYEITENVDIDIFEEHQALKEKVSQFYIDDNKHIENNELFEKLFYGENKYDLELLVSQIEYFEDCESIKIYLNEFDSPFDELLKKDASKLYLDDNSINRQLLDKLKNKDCISSWRKNKKTLSKDNLKVERKRVSK